jgi:hypothetical protein
MAIAYHVEIAREAIRESGAGWITTIAARSS